MLNKFPVWSLACFLPGWAKDLSAPHRTPNWKYCLKYIFESIRFWNFPTKQISVHGYRRHYCRQEFSCSLLPVEPEAVSSLWEATVFDKCNKNVNGFITIIKILT